MESWQTYGKRPYTIQRNKEYIVRAKLAVTRQSHPKFWCYLRFYNMISPECPEALCSTQLWCKSMLWLHLTQLGIHNHRKIWCSCKCSTHAVSCFSCKITERRRFRHSQKQDLSNVKTFVTTIQDESIARKLLIAAVKTRQWHIGSGHNPFQSSYNYPQDNS